MTATQSIIKVTEQSASFCHGGFTAFTERRVTGVLIPTVQDGMTSGSRDLH